MFQPGKKNGLVAASKVIIERRLWQCQREATISQRCDWSTQGIVLKELMQVRVVHPVTAPPAARYSPEFEVPNVGPDSGPVR